MNRLAMFGAEFKIEILIERFDLFAHGCDDVEEAQVSDWSGKVVNVLFKDHDRFSIVLMERTNFHGQWMGLIPLMDDVIFEGEFEEKLDHIFSK